MPNSPIADINRASFSERSVGSWYSRQQKGFGHFREERAALNWLRQNRPAINDLLDIGVGAGRTVEPLRAITKRYVGIDFSPRMVELCREKYPTDRFMAADARDLYIFQPNTFDLVFFSWNGIDYVDHDGRLMILAEVRRLLRPDGYLIFSSHNRSSKPESLWRDRPIWFLTHLPLIAWEWRHRRRLRHFESERGEYEIRNDTGNGWRMLTYYINPGHQVAQLKVAGFDNIEIFDTNGCHLRLGPIAEGADAADTQSPWLCYLCSKSTKST